MKQGKNINPTIHLHVQSLFELDKHYWLLHNFLARESLCFIRIVRNHFIRFVLPCSVRWTVFYIYFVRRSVLTEIILMSKLDTGCIYQKALFSLLFILKRMMEPIMDILNTLGKRSLKKLCWEKSGKKLYNALGTLILNSLMMQTHSKFKKFLR